MKTWIVLIFIPLFAHAYYPTSEKECTPVNLYNETLGSVRDQGEIAWCYAFTASDMLAHTFDLQRISAADIALNYNNSFVGRTIDLFTNYGNPHETGLNKFALKRAMKEGFCPEEIFPSEEWIKVTPSGEEKVLMPKAMGEIARLHGKRHELTESNLPFFYKFNNVGRLEFLELLKQKNLRRFYTALRKKACAGKREPFEKRFKVKMVFKNKKIFYRISEQLEMGRLVGLDYDARILENKDHRGVKLSELHTSSIVGRRWNENGYCEYQVRDSHGEQCRRYDPSYDCHKGNVWLSESQIYGSLISIVYMRSGPKL